MSKGKRVVIDVSSEHLLTQDVLNPRRFGHHASQMAFLKREGFEFIIVSSGQACAGEQVFCLFPELRGKLGPRELSSLGTFEIVHQWARAFERLGTLVCPVSLAHETFFNEAEAQNFKESLERLIAAGIVPVVQVNFSLMGERAGQLHELIAVRTASLFKADRVLFLAEGRVFEKDTGRFYKRLRSGKVRRDIYATWVADNALDAARACYALDMEVAVAGDEEDVILHFCQGKDAGTRLSDEDEFYEQ